MSARIGKAQIQRKLDRVNEMLKNIDNHTHEYRLGGEYGKQTIELVRLSDGAVMERDGSMLTMREAYAMAEGMAAFACVAVDTVQFYDHLQG